MRLIWIFSYSGINKHLNLDEPPHFDCQYSTFQTWTRNYHQVNIIMYYLWTLEIGHRVIKSDLQSSKSSRSCESFFGAAEAAACLDLADGFFTGTSSSELDSSKIQRRQHIHTVKIPANEISAFTFTFFRISMSWVSNLLQQKCVYSQ